VRLQVARSHGLGNLHGLGHLSIALGQKERETGLGLRQAWTGEIFATTEIYDPTAQSWRSGPNLGEARSGFGAVVVDGDVIVAGGEVFSPDQALDSVERLDPSTRELEPLQSLPHGLHGNPLLTIDDAIFLPGGSTLPAAVANDGVTYRLEVG